MRLQSWQPSRHSIGCARLVTELTCLDASREVGAEPASAHQWLCTAETGAGKFQRGSEVVPALIPHIKSKHFLCVTGASLVYLQGCFTVMKVTKTLTRDIFYLVSLPIQFCILSSLAKAKGLSYLITTTIT